LVIAGGDSYQEPNSNEWFGEGGDIYIWPGRGANGGDIKLDAGESYGLNGEEGGWIKMRAGDSSTGNGGYLNLEGGSASGTGKIGGDITLTAGSGSAYGKVRITSNSNNWDFGIDGSTIFPSAKIKGYCFTATNAVFNYLPQQGSFMYTDSPILRLISTIGGAWYIKGPGLVGWKQITSVQDNGGVALIVRIGNGNTPLEDGSEFHSGGYLPDSPDLVYTISQYLDLDVQVADKTWTFDADGNLTLPANSNIQVVGSGAQARLQWLPVGDSTETETSVTVDSNGVKILTDAPGSENLWTFGTNGSLTLPGAVVNSTVAKDGPIPEDIGVKGRAATVTASPSNNTNLVPGTYLGVAFNNFSANVTVAENGDITATVTLSDPDVEVGDSGVFVAGQGPWGGTAPADNIVFSVDTLTDIIAPTAIDLTRSINKLANGVYSLAAGVEGQIMYFVPQNMAVSFDPDTGQPQVGILSSNLRWWNSVGQASSGSNTWFPFIQPTEFDQGIQETNKISASTISYAIFTDGAWNVYGGRFSI
jgi:hypothetical protein